MFGLPVGREREGRKETQENRDPFAKEFQPTSGEWGNRLKTTPLLPSPQATRRRVPAASEGMG